MNNNLVFLALLFLLVSKGTISTTQLLLLLALLSATNDENCSCDCLNNLTSTATTAIN